MNEKFLLDGMLGTLARWLRIGGYDAEYLSNASDGELIDEALADDRILLTRDKILYRKAVKEGADAMLVIGNDDVERLSFVSKKYGLTLDPRWSRCPRCDGLLKTVEKDLIEHKVPQRTYAAFDEFFACGSCGQIYWRGSHWSSIVDTLKKASRLTTTGPDKSENDLYNHD